MIKKRERDRYLREKVIMLEAINNMGQSRVIVENKVYSGVKIIIDSEILQVIGTYQSVQFIRKEDRKSVV